MLPLAVATTQLALWSLCLAVGAGCLLTVCSRRLHIPTIVLLLLGGFALGPQGLDLLHPNELGEFLPMIVSLAVGLILFEGGLTLDLKDFNHTSTVIKRLLTVGVLITWLGSALTAYCVFDISASFALLMGSLIIVTGPTVIIPLLRRIRIDPKIGSILHWEAVLIDSIGVFIAILCFEWVVGGGGAVALPNFLIRIISGAGIGFIGGYFIYWFMKRGWVPDNIVNAFSLACAMLIFGMTEMVKPEAGLLAVTIAGLIVGLKKPRQLREVKAFKAEIVDLLIGLLFLLLVARLEFSQFAEFFAIGGGWVLISVILLIRPISVALSSTGTSLNLREKALLSWVAPRGVVAASMASLFALTLQSQEQPVGDPALMESFVYSVICATVLLQGLSSGLVAKALRLQRPAPNDLVIIGAHHFGRELAAQLMRKDEQEVVLLDTNARNIAIAQKDGLLALHHDGMEAEKLYEEEQTLFGAGQVLALTDNVELNQLLMQRWAHELDNEKVFGWIPAENRIKEDQLTGQSVFGDLSRPAVIGNELLQGESSFESVTWEDGMSLPSGDWHPLYIRRGKLLKAVPQDAALKELVKDGDEVICLRRSEGFLRRALQSGGVLQVDCADIESLYSQLARVAAEQLEGLSEEQILEDLGAQGKVLPTFLGHGIAIPHVYSTNLNIRVCFLVTLKQALKVAGQDEPVDCAFFLISPTGDSAGHLATLADIARSCRSERLRAQIKTAAKVEDIVAAISPFDPTEQ
jgi:NhaP-type Na+/H+ or K+/H+ antiporter/mannitol/fructose-specific phosphotransferase system IIA component (Ntr-type)